MPGSRAGEQSRRQKRGRPRPPSLAMSARCECAARSLFGLGRDAFLQLSDDTATTARTAQATLGLLRVSGQCPELRLNDVQVALAMPLVGLEVPKIAATRETPELTS